MPIDRSQEVRDWLEDKDVDFCSLCGSEELTPGPVILAPMVEAGGSVTVAGPEQQLQGFPLVPVMCNNCGHTMLFNAVRTGIFSSRNET